MEPEDSKNAKKSGGAFWIKTIDLLKKGREVQEALGKFENYEEMNFDDYYNALMSADNMAEALKQDARNKALKDQETRYKGKFEPEPEGYSKVKAAEDVANGFADKFFPDQPGKLLRCGSTFVGTMATAFGMSSSAIAPGRLPCWKASPHRN